MCFFINTEQLMFNYLKEIPNYSEMTNFISVEKSKIDPVMCYSNKFRIKDFCETYKSKINNSSSAKNLNYSNVTKSGFYSLSNDKNYLRFDHNSYIPFDFSLDQTELSDIETGKCLLRINTEKNVVYTVRKPMVLVANRNMFLGHFCYL